MARHRSGATLCREGGKIHQPLRTKRAGTEKSPDCLRPAVPIPVSAASLAAPHAGLQDARFNGTVHWTAAVKAAKFRAEITAVC
jgi:hypothetical protein